MHEKFLEWNDQRMIVIGRYDPGIVLERHGHSSDHVIYVLDGLLWVGDHRCPAKTLIVLEEGAAFGPLFADGESAACCSSRSSMTCAVAGRQGGLWAACRRPEASPASRIPPSCTPQSAPAGFGTGDDRWS